jgi:hypothetical protein
MKVEEAVHRLRQQGLSVQKARLIGHREQHGADESQPDGHAPE